MSTDREQPADTLSVRPPGYTEAELRADVRVTVVIDGREFPGFRVAESWEGLTKLVDDEGRVVIVGEGVDFPLAAAAASTKVVTLVKAAPSLIARS